LSEQIEALGQHLSHVRTKVDRIQLAPRRDLGALERELDRAWADLERCASRVQTFLDEQEGDGSQGARDPG